LTGTDAVRLLVWATTNVEAAKSAAVNKARFMANPFSGFDVGFDPIRADEINGAEYDVAGKRLEYAFSEWCIALFVRDAHADDDTPSVFECSESAAEMGCFHRSFNDIFMSINQ